MKNVSYSMTAFLLFALPLACSSSNEAGDASISPTDAAAADVAAADEARDDARVGAPAAEDGAVDRMESRQDGAADVAAADDARDGAPAAEDGAVDRMESRQDGAAPADAGPGCANALPLRCGDRLNHSTIAQGRPNTFWGYGHTQRLESGRETLYDFQAPSTCQVTVTLGNLAVDLDLIVLNGCATTSSGLQADLDVSSTPIGLQTVETVRFTAKPNQSNGIVVDGYAGAEGDYSLQVDCTCGG